jgi:PPK2 family polyphosphate:nucleotide phosphotransferase
VRSTPGMDTERYRVRPGATVDLADFPADATEGFDGDKSEAKARNAELTERLGELQALLHATKAAKVLVVLQGMDTSGKDSTTRRVFDGVNPLGIRVAEFKRPSEHELAHEYLWRVSARTPRDGEIVVFNRSHYEDVLAVRVLGLVPRERWERRYQHLVDFERRLVDEGTIVRKFFLHISKDEQKTRLEERLADPTKRWKFEPGDLDTRAMWDGYQEAYRVMLERTSTDEAPWYVVPANRKWFRDLLVGSVLVEALERLGMDWPRPEEPLDDLTVE